MPNVDPVAVPVIVKVTVPDGLVIVPRFVEESTTVAVQVEAPLKLTVEGAQVTVVGVGRRFTVTVKATLVLVA